MPGPALIRFVAPKGDQVRAPQAGYVVGLLDVAGYDVRGELPADSLEFAKAIKILGITKRDGLIVRDGTRPSEVSSTIYVEMGSNDERPERSPLRAPGAGTEGDPIVHDGDPIATGRAILAAASVPESHAPRR